MFLPTELICNIVKSLRINPGKVRQSNGCLSLGPFLFTSVVVSDMRGNIDFTALYPQTSYKTDTEDFDTRHEYSTGMLDPLTAILVTRSWKINIVSFLYPLL